MWSRILSGSNIIVVALTETWFLEEEAKFFNIFDLRGFHSCRMGSEHKGGGVSIYVRSNIVANTTFTDSNIDLLQTNSNVVCEYIQMINDSGHCILNKITNDMPTRPVSNTIIDHLFTNRFGISYKLSLIETSLTDHNIGRYIRF